MNEDYTYPLKVDERTPKEWRVSEYWKLEEWAYSSSFWVSAR